MHPNLRGCRFLKGLRGLGLIGAIVLAVAVTSAGSAGASSKDRILAARSSARVTASSMSGSAPYNDGVTDTEGVSSPDIGSIQVANDDYGDVEFDVTLVNQRVFATGDYLFVFIDSDRNRSTGNSSYYGSEWAIGVDNQRNVEFLAWDGSQWVNRFVPTNADNPNGTNSHVFQVLFRRTNADGSLVSQPFSFDFFVLAAHFDSGDNLVGRDIAPGGANNFWTYAAPITPDSDGDGLRGSDDKCPSLKGGRFDKDKDGCPPHFAKPDLDAHNRYVVPRQSVKWTIFAVTNAPAGALVTVRWGNRQATRRGSGPVPLIRKRPMGVGTKITIYYTRVDTVGSFLVKRLRPSGSLKEVGSGCTLPGSVKRGRCL